jgi:hypothetical protein
LQELAVVAPHAFYFALHRQYRSPAELRGFGGRTESERTHLVSEVRERDGVERRKDLLDQRLAVRECEDVE